jgi:hypothetical protein
MRLIRRTSRGAGRRDGTGHNLVRFVAAVKKARGEHGRYLASRAGDRTAIEAAADGSYEFLERVSIDPSEPESSL